MSKTECLRKSEIINPECNSALLRISRRNSYDDATVPWVLFNGFFVVSPPGGRAMRCLTQGERLTYVKTKIISTVGPASSSLEMLTQLVLAGTDVFRLNFAHGTHEWLTNVVSTIRKVSHDIEIPVGILGDLAGPKIRLEEIPGDVLHCVAGEKYTFVRAHDPTHPEWLTCTYE